MSKEFISKRSGETMRTVNIHLPTRLVARADRQASRFGMSRTAILIWLMEKHLPKPPGRPPLDENKQSYDQVDLTENDVVDCSIPYDDEAAMILNGQKYYREVFR